MKKLIVGVALLASMAAAFASCPPDRPYNCRDGWNGKQVCGCGV